MNTLGDVTAKNVMPLKGLYLLNKCFICTALVVVGQPVKLNSNGTISPVAAATDIPLGHVVVGNGNDLENEVTVMTPYRAIILATADGAVTAGVRVSCTGVAAGRGKYKLAVTTNYVVGQALTTAADTAEVVVGVYYNPYLI